MRVAALLAGLLLCTASCSSGGGAGFPDVGNPVAAQRQASAPLLMWRGVSGNPPVFDLVAVGGATSEPPVVAGMSSGEPIRPQLFDAPTWSPDGTTIAFTADVSEQYGEGGFPQTDIYLVRADGAGLRRLTHDGLSSSPVWSPDGRTIVYARREETGELRTLDDWKRVSIALWTITADGEDEHPVFEPVDGRIEAPGGWSPDGSRFLFTRGTLQLLPGEDGRFTSATAVYVVNADGSQLTELVDRASGPAWSPDGRHIAFASDRDENGELGYGDRVSYANELYVMDADGSNQRRLTETKDLNEAGPDWSPDGTLIAYQRGEVVDNAQGTGVFVMKNDGACPTPVAFDEELTVWYANPAWHPGTMTTTLSELECDAASEDQPLDAATVRWARRANAVCEPWQARRAEAMVDLDPERLEDFSYVWRVMRPIEAGIVRGLEAIPAAPARVQEPLSLYRARLALLDQALEEGTRGRRGVAMEMFDRLETDKLVLVAALDEIGSGDCSPP